MKTLIIILSFCITITSCGQKTNNFGRFKITSYNIKIQIPKTEIDTATINSKLDLDFYRKHFFVPYHYPNNLIDSRFKDTTIETWVNTEKEKDYESNWTLTLTYDSLSRVIKYDYSSCFICSQTPYQLSLFYDTKNRLRKIESKMNLEVGFYKGKVVKSSKLRKPDEEIYFKYDEKDNIIQLKQFQFGILVKQIDKL